ncbi:UNVERIFIED_CONTAM: hypothetical protein H355_002414 [Colinus virginianus]|nr:hypothetical protein H355_002414 [Colinus virginianus]
MQISTNKSDKPPVKESRVDSPKRVPERISKQSKGNADPEIEERGRAVDTNTVVDRESMREEIEKILSEKLDVLQRQLEKTQQAIPPMEEMTNTQMSLKMISENVQALQTAMENMQVHRKKDLEVLRAVLEGKETKDGKSVKDTGEIRQVPSKEERFDSHIFVLAKEGYASGKHYWEVDVGKRRNWVLGVASETVARKGTLTLSPKNGFWVIGLTDGQEYWAHTEPWTRLTVGGRPQKIGIFLDISANKLSFYNVNKKKDMYTFATIGDSRQGTKFVPLFSTGSGGVSVLDTEPLKIVQGFDDD